MINIESLKIKDKELCVGDIQHNDYIDILTKDILDSNVSEIILNKFIRNYKTGDWISHYFTKMELSKLNAIMKTKNINTLKNKADSFISYLYRGTVYSFIFNSDKINIFNDIFNSINEIKIKK